MEFTKSQFWKLNILIKAKKSTFGNKSRMTFFAVKMTEYKAWDENIFLLKRLKHYWGYNPIFGEMPENQKYMEFVDQLSKNN